MRRRSYLPALSFLFAALFAAAPAAAQFEVQDVELVPGAPTWQDEVVAHIDFVSGCFVAENDEIDVAVGFDEVVVTVPVSCILDPPTELPYARTVVLGHLTPRDYVLRIQSDDEVEHHQESFTVHPVADLLLDFPDEPVTDAAAFPVVVAGLTSCGFDVMEVNEQPGRVLEIFAAVADCPFLPADPSYTEVEIGVGPLAAGDWEVRLFDTGFAQPFPLVRGRLTVYDDQGCVPSDTLLCLNDDRFRVGVEWRGFQGGSGQGQAIPLADRDDTGLFWFFNANNVELTVKVLDGCGVNDHYWVFVSSGSTVEYTLTVTDTLADQTRIYDNPLGESPVLISDTAAFLTCP